MVTIKKKRVISKKKIIRFIIVLIIVILIGWLFLHLILFKNYGYNDKVIKVFKDENLLDIVKKEHKYSKTLEMAIEKNSFNKDYLVDYINIKYINEDDFIDNINKLLDLGYNSKEINLFYKKIKDDIEIIINNEYDKDITKYLELSYYRKENLDRYIKYKNNFDNLKSAFDVTDIINNFNYEDNVTYVNANLDKEYYTYDKLVSDKEALELDVLVNKYNRLNKDFEPSDLENIQSKYASNDQKLRHVAKEAFEKMCYDASKEGIYIYAGSTYRSYSYQTSLHNKYISEDGLNEAEVYSARAGYSEHQLGLAVDILSSKWKLINEDDIEYSWLVENSYKYGFILRYPRKKEYITGYVFEDWHYRYLGVDLAKKVHDSNLTYDEYVARGLK